MPIIIYPELFAYLKDEQLPIDSEIKQYMAGYPDDPYHVFEYNDPYAFWWDWGDEFDDYEECIEYWDWAWGNLK